MERKRNRAMGESERHEAIVSNRIWRDGERTKDGSNSNDRDNHKQNRRNQKPLYPNRTSSLTTRPAKAEEERL